MTSLKHVGVYDVHNASGDVIARFKDTTFTELLINPTSEGICFYRLWKEPAHEARFFIELDKKLRAETGDGLSAVIIPDGGYLKSSKVKAFIEAVKKELPEISFIACPNSEYARDHHALCTSVIRTGVDDDLKDQIKILLGLDPAHTQIIERDLKDKLELIAKTAEKEVLSPPEAKSVTLPSAPAAAGANP
jgi:hypothetical protein